MKYFLLLLLSIFANANEIKIGIVDSGIDLKHTFFEGVQINTYNTTEFPLAHDQFHGTAVLGLFLESTNSNSVYFIKNIDSSQKLTDSDFFKKDPFSEAINFAIKNNIKILSFSQISNRKSENMIKTFEEARKAGILIVAASGNTGFDLDRFESIGLSDRNYFPCALGFDNIICVGSIDSKKQIFSNYGSKIVDVFAIGEEVLVYKENNQLTYASGSSMATPKITGEVFKIWSKNKSLTYLEVKEKLFKSLTFNQSLKFKSKTGRFLADR